MISDASSAPSFPSFWEAFRFWFKLGWISFGGPAGQIAMMHQELVERRRWISEHRFLHALNFCMVLPGPEAQQLAIYLGWLLHKTWGGIVAGVLFVLPSFFILSGIAWGYLVFGEVPVVDAFFNGIKPAVVAIIFFAAVRIGGKTLKNLLLVALAAIAFFSIAFGAPFPAVVLGAATIGFFGGKLRPDLFSMKSDHTSSESVYGKAVIDDETPIPPYARFSTPRFFAILFVVFALGLSIFFAIDDLVLRDMAIFFTKAAFLTFGGAYAVLPYVFQGGVEQFGWLTAAQMLDGLALGETTPGPLIMIVSFVGFLGGWTKEIFGPEMLLFSGIAGAAVATFFTFLPSFFFIFLGAPLIESTRGDLKFTAPLTAITAAVVGVIFHLGLFFSWHLFFPEASHASPFFGPFRVEFVPIAIGAFFALWRWKQSIFRVVGVSALIGLALFFLSF